MIITRGILQHDQSDCGAAALASVFNMHRLLIPVTQLREAMRVDKSGASIYAIIKTAETYGIRGEGVVGDRLGTRARNGIEGGLGCRTRRRRDQPQHDDEWPRLFIPLRCPTYIIRAV